VLVEMRRLRSVHVVLFLAAVIIGNHLATTAIKDLADRARPTLNAFAATLGPSFPSGHSSTAASFYAAAALVLGRRRARTTRAVLTGCAVGLAVAVAASRVLLDDHWLSDVIAGLALGWAWFALCAIAFGGRLLQFGATVERAERADDV
jgi:membrane-associated phospholipid phosphatase